MSKAQNSRRLVIVSASGGSGRSTLAINLAVTLAHRGRTTMAVELSSQGAFGPLLGRPLETDCYGLADILRKSIRAEGAARRCVNLPALAILFRGRVNPAEETAFERILARPGVLDQALGEAGAYREFVLLDPPSGLGGVTRAALRACDLVLITAPATPLGRAACRRTERFVQHVQETENPDLQLVGVLATQVDRDSPSTWKALEDLRSDSSTWITPELVRHEMFLRSSAAGRPLVLAANKTPSLLAPIEAIANHLVGDLDGQSVVPALTDVPAALPCPPDQEKDFGPAEWNHFLDDCLRKARGHSAFVLDGRGLTVANRGQLRSTDVEGLGTRMMLALEQASRMDRAGNRVASLTIEFESSWLTGITASGGERRLTLGVLGQDPVPLQYRRDLGAQLRNMLDRPLSEPQLLVD